MSNLKKRPTFSSKNLTLIAVFTAIISIVSPFTIQAFTVPISLSSLAIFIASATLGGKNAFISTACYVLLGLIGLPVFSNFMGGLGAIMGVTGGYIIGYLPCAFIVGVIITALGNKKELYFIAFIAGTIILYLYCFSAFSYSNTNASLLVNIIINNIAAAILITIVFALSVFANLFANIQAIIATAILTNIYIKCSFPNTCGFILSPFISFLQFTIF
jgi:biotin transport system substrate-specific component